MLTLSKVVVEVGNRADAARAGDYRLELEAAPEAFARSDYQLAEEGLERRSERGSRRCGSAPMTRWLSSACGAAQAIERDDLIAVLQGQHVESGEQLRRPGVLKREARDEHGQAIVDDDGRPRGRAGDRRRARRDDDVGAEVGVGAVGDGRPG